MKFKILGQYYEKLEAGKTKAAKYIMK